MTISPVCSCLYFVCAFAEKAFRMIENMSRSFFIGLVMFLRLRRSFTIIYAAAIARSGNSISPVGTSPTASPPGPRPGARLGPLGCSV